jgi:hypothetical protein
MSIFLKERGGENSHDQLETNWTIYTPEQTEILLQRGTPQVQSKGLSNGIPEACLNRALQKAHFSRQAWEEGFLDTEVVLVRPNGYYMSPLQFAILQDADMIYKGGGVIEHIF